MKSLFFFVFLIALSSMVHAQDVIIRKDGSEQQVKVLEVGPDQISYQHFDNLDGPTYSEKKDQILKIKYANGSEDVFVKESAPSTVQNQVVWQQAATPAKKVRKVRYSGLVEVSPYIGLDWRLETDLYNDHAYGVCIATSHGIQLVDKYFFGMGIGANIESNHVYVPVYFNFRLNLSKERVAQPFLSFSLGMQFGAFDDSNYDTHFAFGLWSNALIGYQFKSKLYIAVGLTLQNAMYGTDYYDGGGWSYDTWDTEEIYETLGMIASIGFKF